MPASTRLAFQLDGRTSSTAPLPSMFLTSPSGCVVRRSKPGQVGEPSQTRERGFGHVADGRAAFLFPGGGYPDGHVLDTGVIAFELLRGGRRHDEGVREKADVARRDPFGRGFRTV